MEKEQVINWLRNCSTEEHGDICVECPFGNCEDCGGELMKAAADMMEGDKAHG